MGRQRFQVRRDTAANWASVNPVLLDGEPALETDSKKIKIGDGITAYNDLPYDYIGLPLEGDPGDILIKEGYANGDADWVPNLDGGTFN